MATEDDNPEMQYDVEQQDYNNDIQGCPDQPGVASSECLYNKRESLIKAMGTIVDEIMDGKNCEILSEAALRVRRYRLGELFSRFENAHEEYRKGNYVATDNVLIEMQEKYMDALAMIEERLQDDIEKDGRVRASSTRIDGEMSHAPMIVRVEAPREPQVGTFNGNAEDWPAFRDLFIAEVHQRDIDPVNKLLYLQQACVGKAATTLGSWKPVRDNYKAAWELMVSTYDDDYYVIQGILGKLFAVNKQRVETGDSLRAIHDAVNNCDRQLRDILQPAELIDQMWINICKQKLPNRTLDAWEQQRNQHLSGLPTFEQFKKFLDSRAKGKREQDNNDERPIDRSVNYSKGPNSSQYNRRDHGANRFQPYNRTSSGNKSFSFGKGMNSNQLRSGQSRENVNSSVCVARGCTQRHPLFVCETFRAMKIQERLETANRARACRNCLYSGHVARECIRAGCRRCPDAAIKHHYLLCPKLVPNSPAVEANAGTLPTRSQ